MNITIYCVGSLKERYWKEAAGEYAKRLSSYVKLNIVECPDYPCPEGASEAMMESVKKKEGERILAYLKKGEYLIALELSGKQYDSIAFAKHIDASLSFHGASISFVIGGSLGIGKDLLSRCDEKICLGLNTYPHQLIRVMLLEALYRSFRILRHEPYHK